MVRLRHTDLAIAAHVVALVGRTVITVVVPS